MTAGRDGRAILGPLAGRQLDELHSIVTTWGEWKRRHPDTRVLKVGWLAPDGSQYGRYNVDPDGLGVLGTENPDERLPGKQLVLGVERNGQPAALTVTRVARNWPVEFVLGGDPVVLVGTSDQDGRAFLGRSQKRRLSFERVDDRSMRDRQTGTLWEVETGQALEGPLAGRRLEPIVTRRVYWFVRSAFHPDTAVVREP